MPRNTVTYIPNKRHYLFCVDENGKEELSSIIREVQERQASLEVFQIDKHISSDRLHVEMRDRFSRQKMGTFLYIAVEWKRLEQLQALAEEAGFTSEETNYIGLGARNINVFCCRCHGINKSLEDINETSDSRIKCSFCNLTLSVSDHHSKLRNAFLGYSVIS